MNWFYLTLTAVQTAAGQHLKCKEEFEKAFAAARGPREMALFQRDRDDGGLDLYFTPQCGSHAGELLDRWDCSPCERPALTGLHLLVGHSEITYYMP